MPRCLPVKSSDLLYICPNALHAVVLGPLSSSSDDAETAVRGKDCRKVVLPCPKVELTLGEFKLDELN